MLVYQVCFLKWFVGGESDEFDAGAGWQCESEDLKVKACDHIISVSSGPSRI